MPTFHIDANGTDMGCYSAATAAQALDAYAKDAGYSDYADISAQFGNDARAIEIDTDALCAAVSKGTGHAVFQDSYGNGVALMDNNSFDNWQQLAEVIGKNCRDFPRSA